MPQRGNLVVWNRLGFLGWWWIGDEEKWWRHRGEGDLWGVWFCFQGALYFDVWSWFFSSPRLFWYKAALQKQRPLLFVPFRAPTLIAQPPFQVISAKDICIGTAVTGTGWIQCSLTLCGRLSSRGNYRPLMPQCPTTFRQNPTWKKIWPRTTKRADSIHDRSPPTPGPPALPAWWILDAAGASARTGKAAATVVVCDQRARLSLSWTLPRQWSMHAICLHCHHIHHLPGASRTCTESCSNPQWAIPISCTPRWIRNFVSTP